MSAFGERIQNSNYAGTQPARVPEWAPYRAGAQEVERRLGHRLVGLGALAAFLLFSGIPIAVTRGQSFLVQTYGVSLESLLVTAWLIQGATALFAFMLTVRWLRSLSQ